MAWRFDKHITHGTLDNTVRGRVTGRIWLHGSDAPLVLDLVGDCAPDLAGCTLTFANPAPEPFTDDFLPSLKQDGYVGDITASKKCKVFDLPMHEARALLRKGETPAWHWANTLYLEWFSDTNGGVTIQTSEFKLTVTEPQWTLSEDEYRASREESGAAFQHASGIQDSDFICENSDDTDSEGEEWKNADDEPAEAVDPMLVFDPHDHADWMPARAILIKYGFTPIRPRELGSEPPSGRLWELIYALAGRRIYLKNTDHLNELALYEWLDTFLDEDCADCPLQAAFNYHVDVTDAVSGSEEGIQKWLRFFATEKERSERLRDSPDDPMPPREKPANNRDAWLPEPPTPPEPCEWTSPHDTDAPADVDREIRIENLREEIAETTSGEMHETKFAEIPPALEEAYLQQIRDIERDGWHRPMDELAKHHAAPLPPEELTEEALPSHLWQLLHNLACRGFYVQQTNHLTERALYEVLWIRGLRQEAILPGRSRTGGYFYDTIGSYSPEDLVIYQRYYQDEASRAQDQERSPHDILPPRETPPHSRDWRLPQGPF